MIGVMIMSDKARELLNTISNNVDDSITKLKELMDAVDLIANGAPIYQRTDSEKAIDDIHKVDQAVHDDIKFEKCFLDAIKAGKIHGVTFTGKE